MLKNSVLILLYIFVFREIVIGEEHIPELLLPGKCKRIWRPDNLVGRCWGLSDYKDNQELKDVSWTITTAQQCRALCCNLGEKCVTWQFESSESKCNIGGIVRLGTEANGHSNWCDPFPDADWNGRMLTSRKGDTCVWGEELPKQCFNLGDERKSADNKPLSSEECAKACCSDKECDMWQEIAGRGCWYSKKTPAVSCSKDKGKIYVGGRKCLPGFCGGLEDKILKQTSQMGDGVV